MTKLRETPEIATGGTKKFRRASGKGAIRRSGLNLTRDVGAIVRSPGSRKRTRVRALDIVQSPARS